MNPHSIFILLLALLNPCSRATVIDADVCVYGGTSGGVVAAVQAARMGKRTVLVEPGRHLGGLTAGGLSAVDIGDPRSVGGIAREYFSRLVASYGKELNWGERFKGNGGPATGGAYSIEPQVAERVFDAMANEAGVIVLREARLATVTKTGARITEIETDDGRVVRAKIFVDTTYEGDLLAAAGVSYTLTREGNAKYGERYNGIHYTEKYQPRTNHKKPGANGRVPGGQGVWDRDFPLDPFVVKGDPSSGLLPLINEGEPGKQGEPAPGVMAYCFRLCLSTGDDRLPITPPLNYRPKQYELIARFIEAGTAIGDEMDLRWFSKHDPLPNQKWDFNTATFGGNLPGASWEWPEASYARRTEIAKEIENYHRGLLHFLATDPRVPEKVKQDVARFGLPRDEFKDNGGWPHQIYVREGRRMVSDLVLTEHHTFGREIAPRSIGLGSYGTDVHEIRRIVKDGVVSREGKVAGGRSGFGPYQIGYGAIIPKASECQNLFATFALSASHTAFASIRMEPVFMVTSQSAATAACLAIDEGVSVQELDYDTLRPRLVADGQVLAGSPKKSRHKLEGIVLDDTAARFTGSWAKSNGQPPHVGAYYRHDANQKRGEKTATFNPVIPAAGDYEIRLLYTSHENRSSKTAVTILNAGKEHTQRVNQRKAPGSLGVFPLPAGSSLKITVSNQDADGFVVVDGLQIIPAEEGHPVTAGDFGEPRIIVPAPTDPRYHHLAWPKVVTANDGTIVAAYITARKHVNGDGCPAVSISRDGGRTFTEPQILKHFDSTMPYQHGANLALGKAKDGALVLMVMAFTDGLRNNIYGWRSQDHGQSWSRTDTSALGKNQTGSVFGHVFPVPGKGLAVCGHYRQPKGCGLWIAYSTDHGMIWSGPNTITTNKFFEPTFVHSSDRLIGLVRENAAFAYHQYVSDDLGANWRFEPKALQGDAKANHPSPFVVVDPSNPKRLLALQTERNKSRSIHLWQADADSLKWHRIGRIVSHPTAEDFGYPWMTHLDGNDWFLVYYGGEKDGPNSIYGMKLTVPRD
jgi:hypothetical protein